MEREGEGVEVVVEETFAKALLSVISTSVAIDENHIFLNLLGFRIDIYCGLFYSIAKLRQWFIFIFKEKSGRIRIKIIN